MPSIRYCCFGANYSPFSTPNLSTRLTKAGFVKSGLLNSDLIVCRNIQLATKATALFPFKKILIWTHEPGYDSTQAKIARGWFSKPIHVFNVYAGDVFWCNLHFLGSYHYDDSNNLGITPLALAPAGTVITMEKFDRRKLMIGVMERKPINASPSAPSPLSVDLSLLRQSLALDSHSRGLGDIAGRGWGAIAIEESGHRERTVRPWWLRKIELLQDYNFSIAIENSIAPYYVTEKIWQSIVAYSLPIYWGGPGSTIYQTFPAHSFIDVSKFPSNDSLLQVLRNMNYSEWASRMNLCIDAYNSARHTAASPTVEEVLARVRRRLDPSAEFV